MRRNWLAALALVTFGVLVGVDVSRRPGIVHAQVGGPIQLASGWNIGSVSSGVSVFASNLVPQQTVTMCRIAVVLGSSVPLSIKETDGTHTFTSPLNGGTALTAGTCYTFVWELRLGNGKGSPSNPGAGPTGFNFVVGGASTVPILRVTEIDGAVD
jgi:hypothetical protein